MYSVFRVIMSQELYSVEQVADLLNLHVRTVRNYVREGRLTAVRIGKQYRIARADLEAMTGRPASSFDREPVRRTRHVEVSSIVEIDAISQDGASRMTNGLLAAAKGRDQEDQPLRIESIYNEERARLKVVLLGSIDTVATFLRFVAGLLESGKTPL
jgi:excisionase family DNA binding protein